MNTKTTSLKFLFVLLIQTLLAVGMQAQLATSENFSEEKFLAKLNHEKSIKLESGAIVISRYEAGVAKTKLDDKYGLVNQRGQEICKPIYDDARLFKNGYAQVKKDDKWIMINKEGTLLTKH